MKSFYSHSQTTVLTGAKVTSNFLRNSMWLYEIRSVELSRPACTISVNHFRYIIAIAEDKSVAPEWQGYFFCCMLFVTLCISSCFFHLSYHHVQGVGLKVKTALMCLIYKKVCTVIQPHCFLFPIIMLPIQCTVLLQYTEMKIYDLCS